MNSVSVVKIEEQRNNSPSADICEHVEHESDAASTDTTGDGSSVGNTSYLDVASHDATGGTTIPFDSAITAPAASSATTPAIQTMYEYGYLSKQYAPDELVTDAHGNPISVTDAMLQPHQAAARNTVTPHLCYYSPRIPGNTGSAIRLCAVTGTILHLVEPLGFNLQDTKLRRAGLDYHDMAHVVIHHSFDDMIESMPNSRIIAFTAHATKYYTQVQYRPDDILLFGPEPGDIPDPMDIMAGPHVSEQVRLPMKPSLRSLNITNCASIALYEAWRQLGFAGGQ